MVTEPWSLELSKKELIKEKKSVSKKTWLLMQLVSLCKAMEPALACEKIQRIYDDWAKEHTCLWIYTVATPKVTQGSLDVDLTKNMS